MNFGQSKNTKSILEETGKSKKSKTTTLLMDLSPTPKRVTSNMHHETDRSKDRLVSNI